MVAPGGERGDRPVTVHQLQASIVLPVLSAFIGGQICFFRLNAKNQIWPPMNADHRHSRLHHMTIARPGNFG